MSGADPMVKYADLCAILPQVGVVRWIGVRPARRVPLDVLTAVEVDLNDGLVGDRYNSGPGKRQVTLVNLEHLEMVGRLLGRAPIEPGLLRRNVVVEGINLSALAYRRFRVGPVLLEGTGLCEPCSRMEAAFGPGAFNALWGHAGINARVVEPGRFELGAEVRPEALPGQTSLDLG